jgi:hypothetical protein
MIEKILPGQLRRTLHLCILRFMQDKRQQATIKLTAEVSCAG